MAAMVEEMQRIVNRAKEREKDMEDSRAMPWS